MRLTLVSMDRASALAILGWRYPPPYSFYDMVAEDTDDALAEMLDGSHAAALDEAGKLAGFLAFGAVAQVPGGWRAGAYAEEALDLGLGLRPDLTGQGFGGDLVRAALAYGHDVYDASRFRLCVATFNRRAITVYKRAGFRSGMVFRSATPTGDAEFLLMTSQFSDSSRTGAEPRSLAP